MRLLLTIFFTGLISTVTSQSLKVKNILEFAQKNFSTVKSSLPSQGLYLIDTIVINNYTRYQYGNGTEAIFFGTTLTKKDGSRHWTTSYLTMDINYVLELIKQIAFYDVNLTKKSSDEKSTRYQYENSSHIFSLSISKTEKDFSSLMIINLAND